MSLGEQRWPGVDPAATLLIPLGSTEQHGPHLPLDTDSRIADAVARAAAADLVAGETPVTVAPVLPYGASGEHQSFAGTLSIGTEALGQVLVELVRSAAVTFEKFVFVNGHGGNHQAVEKAVNQLRHEGHDVETWSPRVRGGDAHAGRVETSLMMAIAPELVALDRAEPGNTEALSDLFDDLVRGGVAAVSPNGVLGDPTGACRAEGLELLGALSADLAARVQGTP